ncbi:NAD(P)/FAD-dependent oxidoreductase [Actinoalloteichus hymeniacidonis]|uniref:NADH dehydrogenase, FAD-containing subunit n=1 Tax=Actinoalloteichus hymeniacidonis TaxID=340345 RepID=A0AAC9HP13_9PSEU|nr:FAD-dependent oxidoreductase [Actinoalloteichus hymeniacidonis]AOS62754.1 NADH dehydrogenase, FAD-containing subunit [Actinoalloteichus hymeniacidonis]MBB5909215.1 NADH dehydrogenase FAD-containing subunit [Actinoalloteichus hymeniacidonis]
MTHRIVIIGAGYAGLTAAARVARQTRDVEVVLVNASPNFVERVRLHEVASGASVGEHPLAELLHGTGVELRIGWVTDIDPQRRELRIDDEVLDYDTLVYALGSTAEHGTNVPGVAEHATSVAELEAARDVHERITQSAARRGRVTVVGGGLTGIEAATELAESHPGLRVQLLVGTVVGPALSARGRAHLGRVFDRMGIEVRAGARVAEVRESRLVLTDGQTVDTDLTVWATGFGVPDLATRAGLAVDAAGRLLVDDAMRSTSHPDVYGAGDAATVRFSDGQELRMSCATAKPVGQHAADSIVARLSGRVPRPFRFRYYLQCISLGRHDGLIQLVDARDNAKERILTGRAAARVKETVVRLALRTCYQTVPQLFRRETRGAERVDSVGR